MPRRPPGASAPDGYDIRDFPAFAVTVDIVVLTVVGSRPARGARSGATASRTPARGRCPAGSRRPTRRCTTPPCGSSREEAGIAAPGRLPQFGAYGDPGRDPRGNVVSIAFLAVGPDVPDLVAGSDAADARLWRVSEVVDGTLPLAFDHRADPRRRAGPRRRPAPAQRPRHRLRRADLHAHGAAQRLRGRLGRVARRRQLPPQHGHRRRRAVRRAVGLPRRRRGPKAAVPPSASGRPRPGPPAPPSSAPGAARTRNGPGTADRARSPANPPGARSAPGR